MIPTLTTALIAIIPYLPVIIAASWPSLILTLSFQARNEKINRASVSPSTLFLWVFLSAVTHQIAISLQSLPLAVTIIYCISIVAFLVLIYLFAPSLKEECYKAERLPQKISLPKAFLPFPPWIMHRELRAIFLQASLFINIVRSIRAKHIEGIRNSPHPPFDQVKKYSDLVNLFSRFLFLWGIFVFLVAKSLQALAAENTLFFTYAAPSGLILLAVAASYSHSIYLFVKISVQYELKSILSERGATEDDVAHLSNKLEEVVVACALVIGALLLLIGGSLCIELIEASKS